MTDKQLPPLPTLLRTRVVDGVPCISVSEHEYQMREYALQAIAHATQPAEVTDSMIREAFLANGFTIKDGHSDLKPYVYAAARAILALRPERVPMTDDQIMAAGRSVCDDPDDTPEPWAFRMGVWAAEAHHGITTQAKKEGA